MFTGHASVDGGLPPSLPAQGGRKAGGQFAAAAVAGIDREILERLFSLSMDAEGVAGQEAPRGADFKRGGRCACRRPAEQALIATDLAALAWTSWDKVEQMGISIRE